MAPDRTAQAGDPESRMAGLETGAEGPEEKYHADTFCITIVLYFSFPTPFVSPDG